MRADRRILLLVPAFALLSGFADSSSVTSAAQHLALISVLQGSSGGQPPARGPSSGTPSTAGSPASGAPAASPQGAAGAQPASGVATNGQGGQAPATGKTDAAAAVPVVNDAYLFGYEDPANKDRSGAAIDDILVLKVDGLKGLLNASQCVDDAGNTIANCSERPLTLFIDGRQMAGLNPEAVDANTGEVHFHLKRTTDNTEAWSDLLGGPPIGRYFFVRPSRLSLGLQDASPIPTTVRSFMIERIDNFWFVAGVLLIGGMTLALIQLTRKSDLLRAGGTAPVDEDGKELPKAYSLARFQMAFWFALVISSYLFIWLITSAADTISTSVLILVGIGSGTALGAAVVDAGKDRPAPPSRGFWRDILSDPEGICFHRFQMFVWTLVLGIMFVSSVYYDLTMPEFNATLLAMQGISAGTYLGFKIPEK
jgi:hypothetical protein